MSDSTSGNPALADGQTGTAVKQPTGPVVIPAGPGHYIKPPRPSFGRIVHYRIDPSLDRGAAIASPVSHVPAIITRVYGSGDDELVNLIVFFDADNSTPVMIDHRAKVKRGDLPGQWNWPQIDSPILISSEPTRE